MRNYLVEFKDGSLEIVEDAWDISDAREKAKELYNSPIKQIRVMRDPSDIPATDQQHTE
jgi:hypothetical protein